MPRQAKSGQHLATIQIAVEVHARDDGGAGVNVGGARFGIDVPNEPHARLEILLKLPFHFAPRVGFRQHFDNEIGNQCRDRPARQFFFRPAAPTDE